MLQCSQPSRMPGWRCPRWTSAATRLVGPFPNIKPGASVAELMRVRSHSVSRRRHQAVAAGASLRTMKLETLPVDFNEEQKRYLEGFATGLQISRVGRGFGGTSAAMPNP